MPEYNIVVFGGDYAGPEVTKEAVKVSHIYSDTVHSIPVPCIQARALE